MTKESDSNAILNNATALLEDAKILRKSKRYARAFGLAVLSIEEIGKVVILNELYNVSNFHLSWHKQKQKAAGLAAALSMRLSEIDETAKLKGCRFEFTFLPRPLSPAKKAQVDAGYVKLVDILASVTDDDYDILEPKLYSKRERKLIMCLCRGDFDTLKKSAFYVDMNRNRSVVSSPLEINRETTDRALRIASRTLENVTLLLSFGF